MATAGEDAAAAAGAYGGGGAGGKFRKRPFRKAQTTPYDRPPTALRNPSWLSKLVVDPASKLINAGARRFFASFFRKALPSLPPPPPPPQLPAIPAPPPSETAQDPKDVQHQASGPNNHAGGSEPDVHKHGDAAYNHEGSGFSELEQLLKQKTLTRSEIDQLTELLHSKTVDSPLGDAGKRIEVSKPASDISRGLLGDNKTENGASHGFTSNAIISSKMCEDDVATPADLAKTYMGSRQSKVSPSVQSFRSQTVREVVPFVSQSPTMSLAKKPGIFGVTENGFTTPKSRGRSAVYNMARTPYSRVHASDFQKGGSSTNYLYTGASSSHSKLEFDELFGSKQVTLKRRSTVLDDDLGSIGPMRRIRQKSNLLYSNNGASLPTRGVGVVSVASKHQLFPTKEISKTLEKNNGSATPSTSCFLVPTKSSETAAKILEHIDKLSPKEKPSESKRAAIKERFPPKLTTNMLHGQALRSLERLDSSRLLQSTSNSYEPENHVNATLPDASDSKLLKVGSVEEIRPINFVDTVNHVANSEVAFPGRDAPAFADSIHPKFAALPAEKKCSFKMSAPEDFLELDDDIESNGHAPKPLSEGKGKQEMPLVNTKSVYSEELSQNKTAASPEINTPPGFFTKRTDEQTPNGVNTSAKYNGLSANVDLQAGKMNSANGTEIKGSSLALTGSKLERLSSPSNTASGPTDAWPRLPMDDNSLKAGINGKLEAPSVASSSTTTASLFAASSSSYLSNGKISPNPVLSSSVLATSNSESHDITTVSSMAAPSISATTTNASATSSVFGPPIVKPGSSIFPSTSFSTPSTASNSGISDLNAKSEKLDNGTSLGDLKSSSFAGTSSAGTNTIFGLNSTSTATQPQGSLFSTGGGSIASAKPLFPQSGNTTSPQTTMSSLFGSSTSSPVSGTSGVASFNSLNANAPASKPLDSSGPPSAASPESNQVGTSSTTSSGIFAFGATSALPATSSALPSNGVTTVSPNFGASPVAPPETKVLGPSIGTTSALFSFGASSTNAGPAVSSFGISSAASTSTSSTPVFSFSGSSVASSLSNTTPGVVSFGGRSVGASSSSSTTPAVFGFGGSSAASSSGNTTTTAVFGFGGSSASSTSGTTAPAVFGFGGSSAASSSGTTTTVFGFGGNSASSTSGTTTPAVFGFGGSSASPSSGTTTPAVFGFGGSSAASSTTVVSNTTPGTFNFGGSSSASSQASQGSAVTGIFGSNQPPSGFNFGASSSSFSTSNTSPMPFGSTPGASSNPVFGFGTVSSTSSSQPIFGNPAPSFTPSIGSNDQMTMEDSMAEDPVQQQSSSLAVSVFGQPSISPAPAPAPVSSFVFGSPNPNLNPFQFGGQQNQAAPQNPSPFQASGSLEFNGGGSFSLGSNGPDKSGRKIVKVNRNKNRRK